MTDDMGDELLSLGMARLVREPSKLRAESHQVEQIQQAYSVENYSVFILNQECVKNVKTGCREIRKGLESLRLELGNLKQTLNDAEGEATSLRKKYTTNMRTLKHHAQLVDLLDVPHLMNECIRNGLYDESLALAEFVTGLEQKHFTKEIPNNNMEEGAVVVDKDIVEAEDEIPSIIHSIAAEVRASLQLLRECILSELSGKIQLAACLRLVPYLRILETLFSNQSALQVNINLRVQVEFIEARDRWFRSLLDDPQVLSAWLGHHLEIFLVQLRAVLPFINDGASVANALEQAMFFGVSMGRLGFDFRGLLIECFENAIRDATILKWKAASAAFLAGLTELEEEMSCCSTRGVSAAAATVTPLRIRGLESSSKTLEDKSAGGRRGEGRGASLGLMDEEEGSSVKKFSAAVIFPPLELLSFPLLSRLTNALLESFDFLRECAPVSIEASLWDSLTECLRTAIIGLAAFKKKAAELLVGGAGGTFGQEGIAREGGGGGGVSVQDVKEIQASITASSEAVANCVVPHVIRCFSILFSNGGTMGDQLDDEQEPQSNVAKRVKEKLIETIFSELLLPMNQPLPLSTVVDEHDELPPEEGVQQTLSSS